MSKSNHKTLESYQEKGAAKRYHDNTFQEVKGSLKRWLDETFRLCAPSSKVLEIGSGTGRDAIYLRQEGLEVFCSDAFEEMVEFLKERGLNAFLLNPITQTPPGQWDIIFANCVFIHFTDEEFILALKNLRRSLVDGGILSLAMKEGEASHWESAKSLSPRYMRHWESQPLKKFLNENGFEVFWSESTSDQEADHPRVRVICRKIVE